MADRGPTLDRVCFVLSPIGRQGTEQYERFKEILDFVIRPAVEQSGASLRVLRADDIERAGSFIKDILEYVAGAHVVIADLTGQNPNVFYELGVRHALSARTILIAQQLDDIPSDLREYRTLIYETTAKGAAVFRERINRFLQEIDGDPERPDNPVLDRLGSVVTARTQELEAEVAQLREQLEKFLKAGKEKKAPRSVARTKQGEAIWSRLPRILKLLHFEARYITSTRFSTEVDGVTTRFILPYRQGEFYLYTQPDGEERINFYYLAQTSELDLEREAADLRVLMDEVAQAPVPSVQFIVVTTTIPEEVKGQLRRGFDHVRGFIAEGVRDRFSLEIWDNQRLAEMEVELGLRVALPEPAEREL